jgi:hypothetical protein
VCAAAPIAIFVPCSLDVSALVHRHAEAVVIHAFHIRHIYLLCFALMTFLFPRQLGAMDDSDEEMQLVNDVALLNSQLEAAGPAKKKCMPIFPKISIINHW